MCVCACVCVCVRVCACVYALTLVYGGVMHGYRHFSLNSGALVGLVAHYISHITGWTRVNVQNRDTVLVPCVEKRGDMHAFAFIFSFFSRSD